MKNIKIVITLIIAALFANNCSNAQTEKTVPTDLPTVEIRTQDEARIESRTDYVNMTFTLTDHNDPSNNIRRTEMNDRIRGRGNDSWISKHAHKKSYRINFRDPVPLFGLTPARNWVLLAMHRDETLLYNAIPFELGRRFGMPFNHSTNFVEVYLNGQYRGIYLLTEHRQVAAGRIEIDREKGWFVEIDEYFDEEPKFRTEAFDLPVMIKSPRVRRSLGSDLPFYDFIKNDINNLVNAMACEKFPENGYREMIDMRTFASYIMINEIVANTDLSHPRSVFMYRDDGGRIILGPLWDFDSGYGWHYESWRTHGVNDHFNSPDRRPPMHPFFRRFFDDPVFVGVYRDLWAEMYDEVASMIDYIAETADMLETAADRNFARWWYKTMPPFTDNWSPQPVVFRESINKLKNWYRARVHFLNSEFRGDNISSPPLKNW